MKSMDARKYMEQSVEIMKNSIQEIRQDSKPCPSVGAVLVRSDGSCETAYRGELREGDHAEYTLLERKCRSEKLDGSTLFVTLEPCAPGARNFPKLGCAERIVNARVSKVYIGIEDPDPTVCRKGIEYLRTHGIEVEMYPKDLQQVIEECNKDFLVAAYNRANNIEDNKNLILSDVENPVITANIDDLSNDLLSDFMSKLGIDDYRSKEGLRILHQLGYIAIQLGKNNKQEYIPTGIGVLLFGKNPEILYPQAVIRCLYRRNDQKEDIKTFSGPLVKQPQEVFSWYKEIIGRHISRANPKREYFYDYPLEVINELLKNAILHRDYDISGAPIYMEITDEAITIKSPGGPIEPIKLSQIKNFSAPSLSRNPKIMFAFDKFDLAEQRGLGFTTVRELPEKNNIPLPIVSFDSSYLVFKLPRSIKTVQQNNSLLWELNETEIRILDYMRISDVPISKNAIVNKFGLSERTAIRELNHLLNLGLIVREGMARSTVYRVV